MENAPRARTSSGSAAQVESKATQPGPPCGDTPPMFSDAAWELPGLCAMTLPSYLRAPDFQKDVVDIVRTVSLLGPNGAKLDSPGRQPWEPIVLSSIKAQRVATRSRPDACERMRPASESSGVRSRVTARWALGGLWTSEFPGLCALGYRVRPRWGRGGVTTYHGDHTPYEAYRGLSTAAPSGQSPATTGRFPRPSCGPAQSRSCGASWLRASCDRRDDSGR